MNARKIQRQYVLFVVVGAAILTALGCDSPTRPTGRDAPGIIRGPSTLVRVEITGPDTIAPGESVQFKATGYFQDGSSRDVTQEVSWSHDARTLAGSAISGFYTGRERGDGTVGVDVTVPVFINARKPVLVLPTGTFRLTGRVVEAGTAGPVSGATVAIDGDSELVTTSGINGSFRLYGVTGSVDLRVALPGYAADTRRLVVDGHQSVELLLKLLKPRPDVNGVFTMTVTADPGCVSSAEGYPATAGALPESLRVRTYVAEMAQTGNLMKLQLSGYAPASGFRQDMPLNARLDLDRAVFGLGSFLGYRAEDTSTPGIVEALSPSSFVIVDGVITMSIDTLSGTLRGAVMWFDKDPWQYLSFPAGLCWSETHQVQFTR